jgi:sugar lactone lactonase YvrE
MNIRIIIDEPTIEVGESPTWHPDERVLYWADVSNGRLFCYDPSSDENSCCYEPGQISGITLQKDGTLLLFGKSGELSSWKNGQTEILHKGFENGFNDCTADPMGRIYSGMQPIEASEDQPGQSGRLTCIECDGSHSFVDDGIGGPNGIAVSGDRKHLYFADTAAHAVYIYDYDEETGAIGPRGNFMQTLEGVPDGMTLDEEGGLWIAICGGGAVERYSPEGDLMQRVEIPTKAVTSVAFGGDSLETLYVTSLGAIWRAGMDEHAGCVFAFEPGVRGRPEFRSAVGCAP